MNKIFLDKAIRMVRYHGEITMYFKHGFYLRRRKIVCDGACYVSFLSKQEDEWSHYETSCFILDHRYRSLRKTIQAMIDHDKPLKIKATHFTYFSKNKEITVYQSDPLNR